MKILIFLLDLLGLVCTLSISGTFLIPVSLLKAGLDHLEYEDDSESSKESVEPVKVKNDIFFVESVDSLVKYLYDESVKREIGAEIVHCKNTVKFYLESKTLPQTSDKGILFNRRDLLDLLTKVLKMPGNVQKYEVKSQGDRKKFPTLKLIFKNEGLHSPSSSRPSSSSISVKGDQLSSKGTVPNERAYVNIPGSKTGSDGEQKPEPIYSTVKKSHKKQSGEKSEEISDVDKKREDGVSSRLSSKEKLDNYHTEYMNIEEFIIDDDTETEDVQHQTIYRTDDLELKLDSDRSILKLKERMGSDFKQSTPWRTLISMILYEPRRRDKFEFEEAGCKKMSEIMGKILFHYIIATCKLKFSIIEYTSKNCLGRKNKAIRFVTGCVRTKKIIKSYTKAYFKTRYDFVDAIILTTQCSIAKTYYLSTSVPILTPLNQDYYYEKCTLGNYYLIFDYLSFVEYVKIALNKTKLKLERFIDERCTPKCNILCFKGKSSKLCSHVRKVHDELSNDLIKLDDYKSLIEKKLLLCKNYLILNNEFSQIIPETAQYIIEDGRRKDVESVQGIPTVQYPRYAKSDPNSLVVLESTLFRAFNLENKARNEMKGNKGESSKQVGIDQVKRGIVNKGFADQDKDDAKIGKPSDIFEDEWI
ncbi:hypothetical protein FG386_002995 [Cryptosporidium ryanae]|uniref:uncharacterized protein n=1 Tax=Cryptosporidium ryanae TaxID=515981 RepID=UPI00351A2665|nr:hypothetical protein FG386_002995 [Cryptosporidium ryanae]